MSVNGLVTEVQRIPRGSELIAAAASSATVLSVDSAEDFDNAGGDLEINGVRYVYTSSDVDADTVTLASPGLTSSVAIGDGIYLVLGGQIATDHVAFVTMGEGDPAEVIVPFADRSLWPEGVYSDPVPVMLSDDLTSIVEVPGRVPMITDTIWRSATSGDRLEIGGPADGSDGSIDFFVGDDRGYIAAGDSPIGVGLGVGWVSDSGSVVVIFLNETGVNVKGPITSDSSIHGFDIYADNEAGVGTVGASLTAQGRLTRTPSTRRMKKDIQPMSMDVAKKVLALEPVTYRLKAENDGPIYPGFIAEQAAEAGAELWVTHDKTGTPNGFRYAEVTAGLVAIVKQQNEQIAALQEANTGLTNRLDALLKKLKILNL